MKSIIGCLVLIIALTGCSTGESAGTPTPVPSPTPTYCTTRDNERVADLIEEFIDEWDDAFTLASSTSRMNLNSQIAELQRIRRNVNRQDWPTCAQAAQRSMVAAMDSSIDGFIAFMAQEPEATVNRHFERSFEHFDTAAEELRKLRRPQ